MSTDVEICSRALLLVGDKPIASLSETSTAARACANLYPIARRALLRAHPWNCAIKRVTLAALTTPPVYGWGQAFAKPGDLIRLLEVGNCGPDDFAFEGGRIVANTTVLSIRYIADVTEGMWDASLTDAVVARMAADLAYPITKSTSLAQLKAQEAAQALRLAKALDGQENPPEQWGDSPFVAVRGGGSGWGD